MYLFLFIVITIVIKLLKYLYNKHDHYMKASIEVYQNPSLFDNMWSKFEKQCSQSTGEAFSIESAILNSEGHQINIDRHFLIYLVTHFSALPTGSITGSGGLGTVNASSRSNRLKSNNRRLKGHGKGRKKEESMNAEDIEWWKALDMIINYKEIHGSYNIPENETIVDDQGKLFQIGSWLKSQQSRVQEYYRSKKD